MPSTLNIPVTESLSPSNGTMGGIGNTANSGSTIPKSELMLEMSRRGNAQQSGLAKDALRIAENREIRALQTEAEALKKAGRLAKAGGVAKGLGKGLIGVAVQETIIRLADATIGYADEANQELMRADEMLAEHQRKVEEQKNLDDFKDDQRAQRDAEDEAFLDDLERQRERELAEAIEKSGLTRDEYFEDLANGSADADSESAPLDTVGSSESASEEGTITAEFIPEEGEPELQPVAQPVAQPQPEGAEEGNAEGEGQLQPLPTSGGTPRRRKKKGGKCDNSAQTCSDGSICGGRAATVRPGGRDPGGPAFYAPKKS